MIGCIIALIVTIFSGWVIMKKYKPQLVLFFAGIVMMACTIILGPTCLNIVPDLKPLLAKGSTGFIWFDIFQVIKNIFSSQIADIGLIILVVGAFSMYMQHIGASEALVRITIKPLKLLRSPYLVLILSYVVGQHINLVVPSAAGLGLLMMATLYPTLIRLGVHPLAACSVMATTPCLDLGPASGMSNFAAKTGGIDGAMYFAQYQFEIMYPVIACIAVASFITHVYFDKKENTVADMAKADEIELKEKTGEKAPLYYALLPIIPLALVFVFSSLVYPKIKVSIIPAIFIGLFISVILEMCRKKVKIGYDGFNYYLKQMGVLMDVVAIMVAGSVFAQGLKSIGAVNALIHFGQSSGFGVVGMMITMVAIVSLSAALCGSGNAAFLSFAGLVPEIVKLMAASGTVVNPFLLLMPMQLAAGVARSMSPVAGVVIACAGLADQSPLTVAKRNVIPMTTGLVAIIAFTILFFA